MRFGYLLMLGLLVMTTSLFCAHQNSVMSQDRAIRQSQYHVEMVRGQVAAQTNRFDSRAPIVVGQSYVDQTSPRFPEEQHEIRFDHSNSWAGEDTSPDFNWSRFVMALVLLAGGTLVCRQIFLGPASRRRMNTQLHQAPPSQVKVPPRSVAPSTLAISRTCPRADCGRMNPPMAKFCRRCGAPLNTA